MKLFKKIIAITMMAVVCFTLSKPIMAKAFSCTHKMIETNQKSVVQHHTHEYYYTTDLNNNGIPETTKGECTVTVITITYDYGCMCGLLSDGTIVEKTEVHWDCGE